MRSLRWAFILFQCLWLNVVVPGHTRGAFAMPGSKPVAPAETKPAGSCCSTGHEKTGSEQKEAPCEPGDKARCAVCHYAIGLTLPPVFSFDHKPAGLAGILPRIAAERADESDLRLPYFERGPPLS